MPVAAALHISLALLPAGLAAAPAAVERPAPAGAVALADATAPAVAVAPADAAAPAGAVAPAGAMAPAGAIAPIGAALPAATPAPAADDVAPGPGTDEQARQDAAVRLQAQATAAALAGDAPLGLTNLRHAAALAPDDPFIAYDLARAALERPGTPAAGDLAGFVRLPPVNADAALLRAHLLAQAGAVADARGAIEAVLVAAPGQPEALAVRALLAESEGPPPTSRLEARARVGGEGDSNVALLAQDAPTHLAGARLAATVSALGHPLRGPLELDAGAQLRASYHINDRARLRDYDVLGATAWAAGRRAWARTTLSASAAGGLTYAGESGPYFLRELYGQAQARQALAYVQPGLFVQAGGRDFRRFNDTGGDNDRSGPYVEAGALATAGTPGAGGELRGSFVAEVAHGREQRVRGLTVAGVGRAQRGRLRGALAMSYELRDYVASAAHRRDHRLTPSVEVQLALTPQLDLLAAYTYVANLSLAPFRYTRQVGELGLDVHF